jgi:hypothetical protein
MRDGLEPDHSIVTHVHLQCEAELWPQKQLVPLRLAIQERRIVRQ